MTPELLATATAHALREYPNEACGLVVRVGKREEYRPCRNVADDPKNDFVIDKHDHAAAEEAGEIVGVFHSHPDAAPHPSPSDLLACEEWGVPWTILAVHTDPADPDGKPVAAGVHEFSPVGYVIPYEGRRFVMGKMDCGTLVQDFYEREFGIELPDFPREDRFWERGEALYDANFAAAGFVEVPGPSQRGDIILLALRSEVSNHAMIWLDEGQHVLHHPYGHLSTKTVYGGYWAENYRRTIRHRSLM